MPRWRRAGWTGQGRPRCRPCWRCTSTQSSPGQASPCSCRTPQPRWRAGREERYGMARHFAAGALLLIPSWAFAAPATAGSMLTVLLSLALILGGFVAVAWLARRYLPGMGAQGVVRVVGTTPVGARERVVVVEVDDTWLLLGVGGGNVRLLQSQPKPAAKPAERAA